MVKFRLKKKEEKQRLYDERRRLERQLQQIIKAMQNDFDQPTKHHGGRTVTAMQELILEQEALLANNQALRMAVADYEKFKEVVLNEQQIALAEDDSTVFPLDKQPGWRVHFSDDEPSFFFHPLSRAELDAAPNPWNPTVNFPRPEVFAARLFGWEVYRNPLTKGIAQDTPTLLRVRFSKRLRCPLDAAGIVSRVQERELCPMLVTPIGWGTEHRRKVSMQMLQELDADTRVLVHNIPGKPSVRYLYVARRAQWKLPGDRRKMGFSMVIVDSDANRRSRDAESTKDVDWITEGGGYFTLTEIDENTTEVTCEQWVGCESTLHAEYVMIQWTQFTVQWEQAVMSSNLLKC
ncbi:hypothetical protein PHYBOEH_001299 [Phytophthora boehmeriae]|uniref:Uncharacterized protein n=1 Tax=Phytophthora boehmeriae TaxID=109152 RepID=A0A8T1WU86_9STRA|nr:hypothetical protein PHYBOEH_001299 [Phytophthora boehmeriae]